MSNINGGSFFLRWVTAVTVTMIVAVMGAFVSMWSIGEMVAQSWGETAGAIVAGGIFGALLSAGLGFGQALVLRDRGIPFSGWLGQTVLAGAAGMAFGFTLMFSLFDLDNVPQLAAGVMIALAVGVPVGLVQWLLLKPHLTQAQWWPLICIAALLVAFMVGFPLGGEGREWLSVGVVALVTAVLSGAGMVWLARGGETAVAA
ncbi:MAG TPA: hypothetical protein PLD25_14570 [Chloroflexota bacterium]|nr:hypothetical protein [Chloroflexota bacterium]HUM68953.1 hypothetical protein [Chloroflexota bacterium]